MIVPLDNFMRDVQLLHEGFDAFMGIQQISQDLAHIALVDPQQVPTGSDQFLRLDRSVDAP